VVTITEPTLLSVKKRPPYRVPLGMPKGREDWRIGSATSLLIHIVVLFLILTPIALGTDLIELPQGAGGPGPAGGGGGGNRGTGAPKEAVQYVKVAAEPPPAAIVKPPEVKPVTPPPPTPKIEAPQPQLQPLKVPELPIPVGTGGGTGADVSGGSGPGSGGGVGSGIGTGRGSAIGPGTGGGGEANYPPTPTEIFIPPMPVPNSVKGHHLIAEFDVDETGKVLSMTFNETRDGGYNRRLREVLRNYRFRPGTKPDGTPIRMKAQVVVDLY